MKLHVCFVFFAACVSAALIQSEKSAIEEGLEAHIEKSTCLMLDVRKKFIGNNENVQNQLALTPRQRKELDDSLQKFRRKKIDEVQPEESIEGINAKIGVIDELFQGDIILTRIMLSEQLNQFAVDFNENRWKRQAYRNETHHGKWTRGLKYTFDENLSPRAKKAFKKAARLWSVNTCIDLKEVLKEIKDDTDEQVPQQDEHGPEDYDYSDEEYDVILQENADDELVAAGEDDDIVIFVSSIEGCSSSFGRTPYYKKGKPVQVLSLAPECETISIAAHEIGHALGFYHTHARHDRDEFLTVIKENINNYSDNFKKQTNETNDNYGLTYDYGSIMHYGATTGARVKGTLTMVPKNGLYTQTLGSPLISFYDLLMMNMHYNCTDACKNNSTPCKNGGFAHPRNCSRCICPSGYGGDLCDQKPPECGEIMNATKNWTLLDHDPQDMAAGTQAGTGNAPNGTKLEVKIVKLPEGLAVDGCIYAGVEIKTHPDQRRTGYRFCSKDDVNTTLTSNSSTVPVLTYARRRRNITGTVLKFRYV